MAGVHSNGVGGGLLCFSGPRWSLSAVRKGKGASQG